MGADLEDRGPPPADRTAGFEAPQPGDPLAHAAVASAEDAGPRSATGAAGDRRRCRVRRRWADGGAGRRLYTRRHRDIGGAGATRSRTLRAAGRLENGKEAGRERVGQAV